MSMLKSLPAPGAASRFRDRAERRALVKQAKVNDWFVRNPKVHYQRGLDHVILEWEGKRYTIAHIVP